MICLLLISDFDPLFLPDMVDDFVRGDGIDEGRKRALAPKGALADGFDDAQKNLAPDVFPVRRRAADRVFHPVADLGPVLEQDFLGGRPSSPPDAGYPLDCRRESFPFPHARTSGAANLQHKKTRGAGESPFGRIRGGIFVGLRNPGRPGGPPEGCQRGPPGSPAFRPLAPDFVLIHGTIPGQWGICAGTEGPPAVHKGPGPRARAPLAGKGPIL